MLNVIHNKSLCGNRKIDKFCNQISKSCPVVQCGESAFVWRSKYSYFIKENESYEWGDEQSEPFTTENGRDP